MRRERRRQDDHQGHGKYPQRAAAKGPPRHRTECECPPVGKHRTARRSDHSCARQYRQHDGEQKRDSEQPGWQQPSTPQQHQQCQVELNLEAQGPIRIADGGEAENVLQIEHMRRDLPEGEARPLRAEAHGERGEGNGRHNADPVWDIEPYHPPAGKTADVSQRDRLPVRDRGNDKSAQDEKDADTQVAARSQGRKPGAVAQVVGDHHERGDTSQAVHEQHPGLFRHQGLDRLHFRCCSHIPQRVILKLHYQLKQRLIQMIALS